MRNRLSNELVICGFNAVKTLASTHPEEVNRFFLREEHLKKFTELCRLLAQKRHPYKLCDDEELERICKSPRHQGVVAMVPERIIQALDQKSFDDIIENGENILVLDSVGNDNNLGAIARSAAFFGVKHLIINQTDEEVYLTTSAHRVAEGGMEYVQVHSIRDIEHFLTDASKNMTVVGADHRAEKSLRELARIRKKAATGVHGAASARFGLGAHIPVAIVLGNEERGLSAGARKACTGLVRIPGTGNMESLNVAQAANLFMYELCERS